MRLFVIILLAGVLSLFAGIRRRAQEPQQATEAPRPRAAVPWISMVVLAIAAITPPGREILANTQSSEALSSSTALFAAAVFLGGILVIALIEYGIRAALIKRAERPAAVAGTSE